MSNRLLCLLLFLCAAAPVAGAAEDLAERGVVALDQALLDIQTIGRVMNLAAHPDDEDGGTLAYCRHALGLRTFAVFATRGEGGQNEIGPELYRELGALREKETLRACQRLGAKAYFLGFEDFGFSKRPEEALARWGGKDRVVERVVYAIRVCRPDVIFTNHDPDTGHGHHRAYAIAAREAFDLAGDPAAFPEHLAGGLRPWEPTLYLERLGAPGGAGTLEHGGKPIELELGRVDRVRGTTYAEQALEALREHRSQGRWERGGPAERLFQVVGRRHEPFLPPPEDPFDRVNLNRLRVFRALAEGGVSAADERELLGHDTFSLPSPHPAGRPALVEELFRMRSRLRSLLCEPDATAPSSSELREDLQELTGRIDAAIAEVLGISIRLTFEPEPSIVDELTLHTRLCLPDDVRPLLRDESREYEGSTTPPPDSSFQHPLWASPEYDAFDPDRWTTTKSLDLRLESQNESFAVAATRSLAFRPRVTVDFAPRRRVIVLPQTEGPVDVRALALVDVARASDTDVAVRLAGIDASAAPVWAGSLPTSREGLQLVPIRFEVPPEPGRLPSLYLSGGAAAGVVALTPLAVTLLDARVEAGLEVGVVRSYDDTLENALLDLGVDCRPLSADDLAFRDLSPFDAILVDIRAYLVRDDLRHFNERLLDYARAGGVVAVFYQKTFEWNPDSNGGLAFAPFDLRLTRERVVEEDAAVTIKAPDHPLLSFPNRLGPTDFAGWVHERGLYFPHRSYGPEYQELLACHDTGEEPLPGGLLAARLGQGWYVYTAYGWYRQWRAGVPGAYRFLANLVALSRADSQR